MAFVDEELSRKRELDRGASYEVKFGPPSGGTVEIAVHAVKAYDLIDFPDFGFPRAWALITLLDGQGRQLATGEGTLSYALPDRPLAAMPGADWTVRITNNGNRKGTLVIEVAFVGFRPLVAKEVPFKLLNEKLSLVFTDPPPIKVVLKNRTIEWRRQQAGHAVEIRTDPPPANDQPPWTPIIHTFAELEASADVELVYGHDLDDIDLGRVLHSGWIETTDLLVRATIHDGQFAIKARIHFTSHDAKYAGTLDVGIGSGVIDIFLVLEIDDNGRPHFRPIVRADVSGYHWLIADSIVSFAVRGAIESKIEQKLTRKLGDPIAQALMGWMLGDRNRRLINRRYEMQIRYAGDEEPEPVVVLDETPLPPMAQGSLAAVQNIVVLMMENRSFDNMLGFLTLEGRTDVDGLRLDMSNPLIPIGRQTVFRLTETLGMVDPGHGFKSQRNQRGNWPIDLPTPLPDLMIPASGGFIFDYQGRCTRAGLTAAEVAKHRIDVMGFYGSSDVPVYAQLAADFTICDRWFASHPGSTWPNRFISQTGQLARDADGKPEIDNPDIGSFDPLDTKSIFDHLDAAAVDWRYFEHDFCFGRLFERFTEDPRIVQIDDPQTGFWAAARAGTLPPVTYIEPSLTELPPGNDDHAPTDIRAGQELIGRIYNALRESPQWPGTLFIITYDEHGGFFDHVHNESNKTTALCNDPDTNEPVTHFGMRVPTLVVSPLVRAGFCSKIEFDHCSILKTIIQRFMSAQPPNMGPRVNNARSLENLISTPQLERRKIALERLPKAAIPPAPRGERDPNDFHTLMTRLYLKRKPRPPVVHDHRDPREPPNPRDHRD